MFMEEVNVSVLFDRGEVLENAAGRTVEEIYRFVCSSIQIPSGLTAEGLAQELVQREEILSTAVGNGIAIPHPRYPLVKNERESKIVVAYVNEPIDMNAPDVRKVYVMFIILSASSRHHIHVLTSLAELFKNKEFRDALQKKPGKTELLALLKQFGL